MTTLTHQRKLDKSLISSFMLAPLGKTKSRGTSEPCLYYMPTNTLTQLAASARQTKSAGLFPRLRSVASIIPLPIA